jgi:hypothetical protein
MIIFEALSIYQIKINLVSSWDFWDRHEMIVRMVVGCASWGREPAGTNLRRKR